MYTLTDTLAEWINESPQHEADARITAATWILNCKEQQSDKLSLFELGLTSLPMDVWSLTQLKSLKLSRNRLTFLPREISNLRNLEILSISCNDLTSLPHEIGHLTNLTELSASFNHLEDLPRSLLGLHQLELCDFAYNKSGDISTIRDVSELRSYLGPTGTVVSVTDCFKFFNRSQQYR